MLKHRSRVAQASFTKADGARTAPQEKDPRIQTKVREPLWSMKKREIEHCYSKGDFFLFPDEHLVVLCPSARNLGRRRSRT